MLDIIIRESGANILLSRLNIRFILVCAPDTSPEITFSHSAKHKYNIYNNTPPQHQTTQIKGYVSPMPCRLRSGKQQTSFIRKTEGKREEINIE